MTESETTDQATWHASLLLTRPKQVKIRLNQLVGCGVIDRAPTLWQLELGVMRMWHRVIFRSDSIGTSSTHEVRDGWRARILNNRVIRGPLLLLEGAIAPWDHTGLASSSKRVMKHLLAAHHDGHQFDYDLSILKADPGALKLLRSQILAVIQSDSRRHLWLKDLAVYKGYHEALLEAVNRYLSPSPLLKGEDSDDPDITFEGFIQWCLQQPKSPMETWRAWRTGKSGCVAPHKGS
jgi:hypothetical protein